SPYFLVCIKMGRAMMLTCRSSNAIADEQNRHARIEPVHSLRDDAAGPASIEETRGRWLFLYPAFNEFIQSEFGQIRAALQEAVEAQQQFFIGVVPIAERTHMRHVLFHDFPEEASEGWKTTQYLQRRFAVFTDEGSHDRRGARAVVQMQFCEGVR